jgi:hypothetical protein
MNRSSLLSALAPHLIAVLTFLVLCSLYFLPSITGEALRQGDVIQYKGMTQEINEYRKKTGREPLWTNAMFGGMPTYQINTAQAGNSLKGLEKASRLWIDAPIGRFFIAMLGFYILMMCLGVNPWVAIIGSVAFGFATNNFILYEAGHVTKLRAISYLPLVTAGIILAFREKYIMGAALFAAGLGLNLLANHVQMTYYFFLTLPFLGIALLVHAIQKNQLTHFLKAFGVLLIGLALALGTSAVNLYVTYEYSKDTMRGEPILQADNKPANELKSSEKDGLAWDYAMQWSNNTVDLFSSFIPGVAGGGSGERASDNGPLRNDRNWRQVLNNSGGAAPIYWGGLPFTSGPIYLGFIVFFLFLIGLVNVRHPVKWWIGLGVLLTFILSMGKNMEGFNFFLFENLVFFNKFRTPNSVLSVTSFLMPVLSFMALATLLKNGEKKKLNVQALYIATGISALICLYFIAIGPNAFDFTAPGDARYQQAGLDLQPLYAERAAKMRGDAFRSLLLLLLSAGAIWLYLQDRIKKGWMIGAIGILCLFDMWTVGNRYLNHDDFQSKRRVENTVQKRPVDEQILQDPDPHYRVFDASVSTFQSTQTSYFHKSIGGYHAAKLQRFEDIINRHILRNNKKVLDMLNAKYFISQDQQAQQNPDALGNVWFADSIVWVSTPNEEIDALNDFNPAKDVVVHEEYRSYLEGISNPQPNGTIRLTDYTPDQLTYESNSSQEQIAVFSEIWYGPDKGWEVTIDDKPVDHIRVNYLLRGLRVPAGQHTIRFVFDPQSYKTGKMISTVTSWITLLGLLGVFGFTGYQKYQQLQQAPKKEEPKKKAKAKPTGKKKKGK